MDALPDAEKADITDLPLEIIDEQESHEELHEDRSQVDLSDKLSREPSLISSSPSDHSHDVDRTTAPRRVASFASSRRSVVKVPRSQRRGLLGFLSVIYEAQEPKDYPNPTKWIITIFVSLAATAAPIGTSIIYPALNAITTDFHTSHFIANLSIAVYMLAMSIFPLWWSAFSESAGRRTVYIVSFSLYLLFNILGAVSTSIGMFIAMRLLAGGTSASVQAVGAGTIADIWQVKERGRAVGIFYLGPLCGPLLSPVVGGALTNTLGWRSTIWAQVVYGGLILLCVLFFLPETHKHSVLKAKAEQYAAHKQNVTATEQSRRPSISRTVSRQSVAKSIAASTKAEARKWTFLLKEIFIDPLMVLKYLRFPPVALVVYYASIAFGSLYFLNISVQKSFSAAPYGFNDIIIGTLYFSNSLGYVIASIFGGPWVDRIMAREARKAGRYDARGKLIYNPQDRMRENAWTGAVMMPAALIWYGWSVDKGVFWFVPILANFFFGMGSMLIFGMATTMLTELMPKKASSGVALNNFCRNIFSFSGTLLSEPLINAIGNGWLFTILGIVTLLSSAVILAMRRWGEKWRLQMEASDAG